MGYPIFKQILKNKAPGSASKHKVSQPERSPEKQSSSVDHKQFIDSSLLNHTLNLQTSSFYQRVVGNQTVARHIQAKLRMGKPGDKYEQEADSMAEQVVQMQKSKSTQSNEDDETEKKIQAKPLFHKITPFVQRQQEDEENVQTKSSNSIIQKQEQATEEEEIVQSRANDLSPSLIQKQGEEELIQPESKIQLQAEEDEQPVQAEFESGTAAQIQRQEEEDEVQAKSIVQRQVTDEDETVQQKSENEEEKEADIQAQFGHRLSALKKRFDGRKYSNIDFENRLKSTSGSGLPIPPNVRETMENVFSADLSQVRIHVDVNASQLSNEIGAKAFTYHNHIFFNQGQFDISTLEGRKLLAHELTHTVQQQAVKAKTISISPGETAEKQLKLNVTGETEAVVTQPESSGELTETSPVSEKEKQEPIEIDSALKKSAQKPGGQIEEAAGQEVGQEEADRAPASPEEDPEFQETLENINKTKKAQRKHLPAEVKKDEVKKAAILSETEQTDKNDRKQHLAKINEAADTNEKQTDPFTAETFKKLLQSNLDDLKDQLPRDESAAKRFKKEKPLEQIKQNIKNKVNQENKKVVAPIPNQVEIEKPPPSGEEVLTPEKLKKDSSGKRPRPINPEAATPKPLHDAEISMEKESQALDELMAENNITEKQLVKSNSNEPSFDEAVTTKQEAQEKARAAPQQYREQEQPLLENAQKEAKSSGQEKFGTMFAKRKKTFGGVFSKQEDTEKADEKKQRDVNKELGDIYNHTKKMVTNILDWLSKKVDDIFTTEADAAKKTFERKVEEKLDDIYGFTVIDDWLFGEDTEAIEKVFIDEKRRFVSAMDRTLDKIANLIAKWLNEAVKWIRWGRRETEKLFTGLDEKQKEKAKEALTFFKAQYDNLEDSVNEKQHELAETLAESYKSNKDTLRETFDKIKEEVSTSWIAKAANFLKEVAIAIAKLAELLWSVLSRLSHLIGDILADPIRFLENLGAGIKAGFDTFISKIDEYLIGGFFDWIKGSVGGPAIVLPKKFDVKGMFSLATQLLSLDYSTFRKLAVKKFGKKIVSALEKGVEFAEKGLEIFRIVQKEGLGALWEHIKKMVSSSVDEIFKKIKETVLIETIKKALAFVATLFTPAGAFIKAVQLLYKGLVFLVDNIDRIRDMVNAFLDSVELAIKGDVSGIKSKVIIALRNVIVMAIDFLAKILGLGKLGQKVRKILKALRKPIIRAMSWLLDRLKPIVRRVFKRVKALEKKGKAAAKAVKEKVITWWKARKKFKDAGGESHTLFFKGRGKRAKLMIKSNSDYIKTFINNSSMSDKNKKTGISLVDKTESTITAIGKVDTKLRNQKHSRDLLNEQKELVGRLSNLITDLSEFLRNNLGPTGLPKLPPPIAPQYLEKEVSVEYLTTETIKKFPGSKPSTDDVLNYKKLRAVGFTSSATRKDNWVRMHVLNRHLGGSGSEPNNLVMGPSSVNLGPDMRGFEGKLKKLIVPSNAKKKKSDSYRYGVAWMKGEKVKSGTLPKVDVSETVTTDTTSLSRTNETYPSSSFINQINYSAGTYNQKSESKWTRRSAIINTIVKIPVPDLSAMAPGMAPSEPPSLKTATPLLLKQAYVQSGGSFVAGDNIFKHPAVPELRGSYSSIDQVINRIKTIEIPSSQKKALETVIRRLYERKLIKL